MVAGSIGSEIARQVILYNPAKVVLLDIAESPLYELELSIQEIKHAGNCESVIADIRNIDRMRRVFDYLSLKLYFMQQPISMCLSWK